MIPQAGRQAGRLFVPGGRNVSEHLVIIEWGKYTLYTRSTINTNIEKVFGTMNMQTGKLVQHSDSCAELTEWLDPRKCCMALGKKASWCNNNNDCLLTHFKVFVVAAFFNKQHFLISFYQKPRNDMTVLRDSIIYSSLTIIHNNKSQDYLWLNSWNPLWHSRLLWFSGILCTATSERCLSGPCQNGASCVDTEDDYACICPTGGVRYMGKNCDELYDACFFAPCENCTSTSGSTEYHCICTEGLSGDNCTEEVDECRSSPCSYPRSLCVDQLNGYFCRCPEGFGGRDCRAHATDCIDGPCMNNGTCVLQPEGFECDCAPGFEGETCEEDINECLSDPCQNGAICTNGVAEFHCFCVPGFQGYNCELDINECASRPCENNGTCINEKDHYECECLMGFAGKYTPCLTVWMLSKHKLHSLFGWYRKACTLTNALRSLHRSPFPLLFLSLLCLFPTNWMLQVTSMFSDVGSGIIYVWCVLSVRFDCCGPSHQAVLDRDAVCTADQLLENDWCHHRIINIPHECLIVQWLWGRKSLAVLPLQSRLFLRLDFV